jgi:DSF synthase
MDRLSTDLGSGDHDTSGSAISLPEAQEELVQNSLQRLAVPERLLHLHELDVMYDAGQRALWTFMRPALRPSFTPSMLNDFEVWQDQIGRHFGPARLALDYLILGSRSPGVFCFGGDLALFEQLIRAGNREGLVNYGLRCVAILHRNLVALDLPLLTVGLVQGQALGGGFEALLSFDMIIAERGTTFGLPEIMFGLFPGMGAHAFLSRKLGTAQAERMIQSNLTYSAEQMYEMGIVSELAEPGCGVAAVRRFIEKSARRHSGLVHARRAMRLASPLALSELQAIVGIWAAAALQLSESDLKLMHRLASAQRRNYSSAA